jgi:hypothetical protein
MTTNNPSCCCRLWNRLVGAGALALALLVSGCGPSVGDVSGKVLQKDGTPLPGGAITFHVEGKNPVSGIIQPDGSYTARNVHAGPAKISVDTESLNPKAKGNPFASLAYKPPKEAIEKMKQEGKEAFGSVAGKPAGTYVSIDKAFARPETSDLKAEISGGAQHLDVQLPK